MRGKPLTDEETAAMRAHITEVALQLVDTEGRDACSLRRVGIEAGISRTTPYTYFADKEALLDAVRVAALDKLSDGCKAALRKGTSIADRLRSVGTAYVDFALSHPALYDLIFEPHAGGPRHERAAARYRKLAESPLREAAAQGMIALEPERLAHVLWAATHGVIGLHRAGKLTHGVSFSQVLGDLGDTLAFGFVPRDPS